MESIRKELDEIKEDGDKAYAERNALFNERNVLKERLDDLFTRKKTSAQAFRDANDRYHLKMQEDRNRRNEKRRLAKQAEEVEKIHAVAERLREEADYPAYQREIEECQLLLDHFSFMQKGTNGNTDGNVEMDGKTLAENGNGQSKVSGVPAHDLRLVDSTPETGLTALKKKGEDENNYFVGGKGKKKGGRSSTPQLNGTGTGTGTGTPTSSPSSSAPLRLPFHIVETLMKMSIPTPSPDEIPRVMDDIKTKKSWFEANQAKTTEVNRAKAEKEIQRLLTKTGAGAVEPPNGLGEKPAEPVSTPADTDVNEFSNGVSTDVLDAKLETVQE